MRKINPQTPLGQLITEKRELRVKCRESEIKIKDQWQYIHSHAGHLLWSELATVFMPRRKNRDEHEGGGGLMNNPWMHTAWKVAKPLTYHWLGEMGWKALKHMFRKKG